MKQKLKVNISKGEVFLNRKAFSLIELLISLAILSIIILSVNKMALNTLNMQKIVKRDSVQLKIISTYKFYLKQRNIIDHTGENITENLNANFKEHISGVAITPPLTDTVIPSDITTVPEPLYGIGVDKYATRALANVGNGLNIYQKSPSSTDADKILIPSTGLFLNIDGGICSPACTSATGKWKVWVQLAKLAGTSFNFYLRVESINTEAFAMKEYKRLVYYKKINLSSSIDVDSFFDTGGSIDFLVPGIYAWTAPFSGIVEVTLRSGQGGWGPHLNVGFSSGEDGGRSSFRGGFEEASTLIGQGGISGGYGHLFGFEGRYSEIKVMMSVIIGESYAVVVGAGGDGKDDLGYVNGGFVAKSTTPGSPGYVKIRNLLGGN